MSTPGVHGSVVLVTPPVDCGMLDLSPAAVAVDIMGPSTVLVIPTVTCGMLEVDTAVFIVDVRSAAMVLVAPAVDWAMLEVESMDVLGIVDLVMVIIVAVSVPAPDNFSVLDCDGVDDSEMVEKRVMNPVVSVVGDI